MLPCDAPGDTPTILVVDDAPANLTLVAGLLNKHYRVKLASSGAKALALARQAPPDLVLLDVMMPVMDGHEVCRQLKADPATRHIPVIFLTAMQDEQDEAMSFEVGGADFIPKPIRPPVLQARVRTHLQNKSFQDQLDEQRITLMAKSAPLHDIGKVAIPDNILLKPGKLTAEEFDIMKTHAMQGWDMLQRAALRMGDDTDFLTYAMQIARSHHEKWDGSGYPDALAGTAIPLSARLMAVADVYDALISRRPYKEPMSHEASREFIERGSGAHFDPDVVQALRETQQLLIDIAHQWKD